MANPIVHCLDRLNLGDNVKIKQRAEQFQGQLSSVPNKIFDKGPNLKAVICIQLAYESLKNYDWDIKLGAQLAGCTKPAYESVLSIVRQRLNIQTVVTLDMLAVALGSTTMLSHANSLWNGFTTTYLNKLSGAKKLSAQKELEQSCWKGAIMYTCAKSFGTTMDKNQLHTICGCSTTELNKCIKVVRETCDKYISKLKNESTTVGRPTRKRTNKELISEGEAPNTKPTKDNNNNNKKRKVTVKKDQNDEVKTVVKKPKSKPVSGIVSMINHQDYTKTKKFTEYKNWKSKLIQELNSSNLTV